MLEHQKCWLSSKRHRKTPTFIDPIFMVQARGTPAFRFNQPVTMIRMALPSIFAEWFCWLLVFGLPPPCRKTVAGYVCAKQPSVLESTLFMAHMDRQTGGLLGNWKGI